MVFLLNGRRRKVRKTAPEAPASPFGEGHGRSQGRIIAATSQLAQMSESPAAQGVIIETVGLSCGSVTCLTGCSKIQFKARGNSIRKGIHEVTTKNICFIASLVVSFS
jgi:hypothetical protein